MVNIRFAKENDVEHISRLCKEHALFEKTEWLVKNHEKRLQAAIFTAKSDLKCLVVENNAGIIGYATFIKQFSTWDADYYIYLDCLYLTEKARGKGIGKQIMRKIKEFAESENCILIQWQTPVFNTNAIHFYQKLGAISKQKERFFWYI